MKYVSTRGQERDVTFEEVLFAGYSRDGGLYFPNRIPRLSEEQLQAWSRLSYPQLMVELLSLYVDPTELNRHQLQRIADKAFARFQVPDVARVAELAAGLRVSELFHGPTLAFKDLGLGAVGLLIQEFQARSGRRCLMLVGTSGDTGSAAIQAVMGLPSVDIVVLLPHGRCTRTQELQMTTCLADNVHVFACDGDSDALDVPIKAVFGDTEFAARHQLISTNSINWARIVTQMTHFFYGYYRVCGRVGEPVQMVLPTGAGGNLTAGCVAAHMGLPITLVAAVNKNDIMHRTLSRGDLSRAPEVVISRAPAMDIQVPYNVERLLLLFSGWDTARVAALMTEFEAHGRVQLPADLVAAIQRLVVATHVASDGDIAAAQARCWTQSRYALCPHTATAVDYHYRRADAGSGDGVRRICVATAGPDKFPESLVAAGVPFTPCERIRRLETLPTRSEPMPRGRDWERMLRHKIESITARREAAAANAADTDM